MRFRLSFSPRLPAGPDCGMMQGSQASLAPEHGREGEGQGGTATEKCLAEFQAILCNVIQSLESGLLFPLTSKLTLDTSERL